MINIELRDYFASLSLPYAHETWKSHFFSKEMEFDRNEMVNKGEYFDFEEYMPEIAEYSYLMADAMMEARNKSLDAKVSIDAFTFSVRTYNVLNSEGINSIHDLLKKSETELLRLPNCGRRTTDEIKKILAQHNLKLRNHYE